MTNSLMYIRQYSQIGDCNNQIDDYNNQIGDFDQSVVQLKRCPLECDYYGTPDRVLNGECCLIASFRNSTCNVFHFMCSVK